MAMNNVLVTGAAGFIGSHLCDALIKNGHTVVGFDDLSAGTTDNIKHLIDNDKFTFVVGDVTNDKDLDSMFGKNRFDVVFHEAASKKTVCLQDPHRDLMVNAGGTLKLLHKVIKNNPKCKFIHASTGSVYGNIEQHEQTKEDHTLNPTSYYGVSKLAGEKYVRAFGDMYDLDYTILRYFHVFGERQNSGEFGGVVAIFIKKMLNHETITIFGDGTQERVFTDVNLVVETNLRCIESENAKKKTYNIASGETYSLHALIKLLEKIFGIKANLIYEDWQLGDIKYFDVNSDKFIKDNGNIDNYDLEVSLRRIITKEIQ